MDDSSRSPQLIEAQGEHQLAWHGIVAKQDALRADHARIVIGVASVITLVAVGTGSQAAVQASIDRWAPTRDGDSMPPAMAVGAARSGPDCADSWA